MCTVLYNTSTTQPHRVFLKTNPDDNKELISVFRASQYASAVDSRRVAGLLSGRVKELTCIVFGKPSSPPLIVKYTLYS